MLLICMIDLLVVFLLVGVTLSKGIEDALPWAAFTLIVIPTESLISFGFFRLTTQRLVILTVFALYLLYGKRQVTGRRSTPLKWFILFVIFWDLVSTANSVDPMTSLKALLSQSMEYYLLYFVYWKTISDVRTIHKILAAIVAAMATCSLFGVFEIYTHWSIISLFPSVQHMFGADGGVLVDAERGLRVQSSFDHPILFGGALALAVVIAFYLLSVTSVGRRKAFLWFAIMLMFLNIYKTGSRGPWIALGLGLILLYILGHRRIRRSLHGAALLILIVLVARPGVWGTLAGIYANTSNPTTTEYSSYEYRYALLHVGVAALSADASRALWGYGMGSFYSLHLWGDLGGRPYEFLSCDSVWVGTMVETGYVGLLLFALMLFAPAIIAFGNYRKILSMDRYLSSTLFVNMVMYYLMMISVAMYSWGQNGYMLWLVIAASMSHQRIWQAEREPATPQLKLHNTPDQMFAHARP